MLSKKGITPLKLESYTHHLRTKSKTKFKTPIKEIDFKTEGCLVYSEKLSEKPINLMLRLDFLIQQKVAKRIYPKIS